MKYALAIAATGFALAGCGSSLPANHASYTITPNDPRLQGVYVTFSGPPGAARAAMRDFKATLIGKPTPQGSFKSVSRASGANDCTVDASSANLKISVSGSNSTALVRTLCAALTGR